jgi:fatty-acyl-CoA synthase
VTTDDFDPAIFASHLAERLPEYARPIFLRLCRDIATTGTFKPQKQALAREGFDPAATDDALYAFDRSQRAYAPLSDELHRRITAGDMRL